MKWVNIRVVSGRRYIGARVPEPDFVVYTLGVTSEYIACEFKAECWSCGTLRHDEQCVPLVSNTMTVGCKQCNIFLFRVLGGKRMQKAVY
jgi:hypothetical protein